jgi:hypothetical protein
MTSSRTAPSPPSMAADRTRRSPGWRWPLRIVATLMTILLWTQPLLIGLFLGGDYDKLAAHLTVGGILVALTMAQFLASVPAWRPGGLPGWVVAVCAAMTAGGVVQIAAGFQRNLGLHVPLGVALAAAGLAVAIRAWWPSGPRRGRVEEAAR